MRRIPVCQRRRRNPATGSPTAEQVYSLGPRQECGDCASSGELDESRRSREHATPAFTGLVAAKGRGEAVPGFSVCSMQPADDQAAPIRPHD